ncbi:LAMI_0D04962g1_1 [Lachancea mirantina]|uniref:LAMI_0D04962g1_1 n=1 Tax=Lachancea mirantina TaxID=1230905 RepID=A0A1G4JAY0_9SACH|nr:LAMI_0D04962g1_1 [Lachancea mirantina]
MITFSHKGKSQRPKFLFYLRINELTNIPQSSGYCYVKWQFKDGTGTSSHSVITQENGGVSGAGSTIHTNTQSRGLSPRVLVKAHRAKWNHELEKPVQVKLTTDKERRLHAKYVVLEVFFEFLEPSKGHPTRYAHSRQGSNGSGATGASQSQSSSQPQSQSSSGSSVYTQKVSRKILLGSVQLDISQYINEDQSPVTSRFLLQHSKINSILSVSVKMVIVRGSFGDFRLPGSTGSGQLPSSLRNGLGDVLDEGSDVTSPISSTFPNGTGTPSSGVNHTIGSPTKSAVTDIPGSYSIAISNPLVDRLYQKTFQIPWDPRPGEYTPRECVEDILDGGDGWAKNENGINLIDIEALQLTEIERDERNQGPDAPIALNYGEMDTRAFLERQMRFEAQLNPKTNAITDRKQLSPTGSEDNLIRYDMLPQESDTYKSWTIGKILP